MPLHKTGRNWLLQPDSDVYPGSRRWWTKDGVTEHETISQGPISPRRQFSEKRYNYDMSRSPTSVSTRVIPSPSHQPSFLLWHLNKSLLSTSILYLESLMERNSNLQVVTSQPNNHLTAICEWLLHTPADMPMEGRENASLWHSVCYEGRRCRVRQM